MPLLEQVQRVMFDGQISRGAWVSTVTVTTKLHDETRPHASVALQLTVVVPGAKTLPEGRVQPKRGLGSQSSVTVNG